MSLGPPNGPYNIGAELRALKEDESEAVQTAIDNIIADIQLQTTTDSQFPIGDHIYDRLNANYNVLLTAKNPKLQTIASKYLGLPEFGQPPNGTTGGRRRRHKRKTMKRRRSATKRRHHRKTGRRNRH